MADTKPKSIPKDGRDAKSPQKAGKPKSEVKRPDKLPSIKFDFLTEEKVQQAAHLYTKSLVILNPAWKKMGASFNQAFGVNRGRMIASVKAGWGCMMIDVNNNDIVAIAPSVDLIDYMSQQSMPSNSLFLKTLGKYGHELEDDYFNSLLPGAKRGQYLYNYGGVVNHLYVNGGISTKFWSQGLIYVKTGGWKTCLFRSTNRITTKLLSIFGAKVIKVINLTEPGMEGEFMELLRLDLDTLTYDTLTKFLDEKDPNIDELQ